jgi:hypothetical protein
VQKILLDDTGLVSPSLVERMSLTFVSFTIVLYLSNLWALLCGGYSAE